MDQKKMKKGRVSTWLVSIAAGLFPCAMALAANFSVFPLRAEFDANRSSEVFTIRNMGTESVSVQSNALKWSQKDGRDVLDPTRDVLVAPAVIEIPPNESQVIRVALRRSPDPGKEESYRLLVQEIPKRLQANAPKVTIALNISLPIFVAPGSSAGQAVLDVGPATAKLDNGKRVLQFDLRNQGNVHLQITSLTASDGQGPLSKAGTMFYLLPGASRSVLMTPERKLPAGGNLKIEVQTPKGPLAREVLFN